MLKVAGMTLAIGMMAAAAPARAQTYDPRYPVCIQTYGIDGGIIECSFSTLAQCAASASGRAAQCINNPFFAGGPGSPLARPRRGY
ncbi:MAG: DUF3551 domain-containing protein [bacterium]|nr:DUF3551 domain-containing protein [bacterium]